MRKRHKNIPLSVYLNRRKVGTYSKHSGGEVRFTYAQEWLDWPHAMAVSLSLPLQRAPYSGRKVSAYFNNLLPDSQSILNEIAERTGAQSTDAFDLLSKIGMDCVGALQFIPTDQAYDTHKNETYEPLSEKQIRDILIDLKHSPLGIEHNGGFRISIAGAQEKAAFLRKNGEWCRPIGTTPTTHIFKPQIGKIEFSTGTVDLSKSVENEYYCLNLMRAFGLETANVELGQFGDKKVLIVERFDRAHTSGGKIIRLPQEDMCQALGYPPTFKYQSKGGPNVVDILSLLSQSDNPAKDQETVFKSQILFWLIGATDGHAKNFSIFLRANSQLSLTPLYDILSAQPMFDRAQIQHKDFRLAMSVGRKPHYKIKTICRRYYEETAEAARLSTDFVDRCIAEITEDFDTAFESVETILPTGFPKDIHTSIKTAARTRLSVLSPT